MFQDLNNDKAYFLGFFSADGCVERNHTLSIELQERDNYLLKEFQQLFDDEGYHTNLNLMSKKIQCIDGYHVYSRLRIYGKELCEELLSIGITYDKSLTIKLPNIPDKYMPDYIRGVFDGDGSISERRKYLEPSIVSGSKDFIQGLIAWVTSHTTITNKTPNIERKKKSDDTYYNDLWRLCFYSKEAIKFCELIYNSSSRLYLKRKKDIYTSYKFTPSPKIWTSEQIEFLKENYISGDNHTEGNAEYIANIIGKTKKAVQIKACKLHITNSYSTEE